MSNWMNEMRNENPQKDIQDDLKEGRRRQSLAIAIKGITEAIKHRSETLIAERGISFIEFMDGDWTEEFRNTDTTYKALWDTRKTLETKMYHKEA